MLRLNEKTIAAIHDHGITSYPFEGCGLLLGRVEGDLNIVEDIFPVPNSWPEEKERTVRFRISDGDMLQAELAAAARDLDIVGIFHSHPDSPPIASPRDLAWAAWPGHSYLITEISQQQPGRSRSWQLEPDRSGFVEETIIVE
ncbi:MAG: M67 family metallopeptidase [Chloroflexota bacterium]|jgi:proteasome lid subunit RPN8/RPN11